MTGSVVPLQLLKVNEHTSTSTRAPVNHLLVLRFMFVFEKYSIESAPTEFAY